MSETKLKRLDRFIFKICNLGILDRANGTWTCSCVYTISIFQLSPLLSIYIRNTCVLLYRVPCLWQGRFGIYFARAKHLSQPQKAKSRVGSFAFDSSSVLFYIINPKLGSGFIEMRMAILFYFLLSKQVTCFF